MQAPILSYLLDNLLNPPEVRSTRERSQAYNRTRAQEHKDRLEHVIALIRGNPGITVYELMDKYQLSNTVIRQDLKVLLRQGSIRGVKKKESCIKEWFYIPSKKEKAK